MALRYNIDLNISPKMGLIVLQSDETIENEFRQVFAGQDLALYHSRIPSAPEVTPETLAEMEAEIPKAVALFPPTDMRVIGYACTSGATVIGPDNIAKAVQSLRPNTQVTDPLSAVIAWCRALEIHRIGFLTPYQAEVSAAMRRALEAAGLAIVSFGSFEQENEHEVACISEASILEAIQTVNTSACEAVFVSCTNLRAARAVQAAAASLGKPVASSNTALAWHMQKLAKLENGNER